MEGDGQEQTQKEIANANGAKDRSPRPPDQSRRRQWRRERVVEFKEQEAQHDHIRELIGAASAQQIDK